MYTNLFILHYFQSNFVELIMMLYRADASSKQHVNFKAQKNGFKLNIKPQNVIKTAAGTSIKTEPEEKEKIEKNNEKLNQKIKKRNQRKKNLLKINIISIRLI